MTEINLGYDVKKVYHIADIHIRTLKRHREYKSVFTRLYKFIRQHGTKDAIIYVGGDIVHAKTELSPESVKVTSDFLRSLAKLAPTFVITGNHDCSLQNRSRLDSLSPIIENVNHPDLYYLKDTNHYRISNLDVVVMSIFDEPTEYPKGDSIEGDNKIAWFHGPLHNSKTDVGYVVSNRSMDISKFDGYDMVMLGDIHKRQDLQKYNRKQRKPIINYVGSLIQQNHGEALTGHGINVWDVDSRKYEFFEIENDYGFYTLTVSDGNIPDVSDIPKKPRLRIKISNTDTSDIKRVLTEIRKKYKVQEFGVIRDDIVKKHVSDTSIIKTIGDIGDIEFQNKLILDYISDILLVDVDDSTKELICSINKDINTRIDTDISATNINWKPKTFHFSNMFSYGEDNIINFDNMNGMIGLFAPNRTGKSAIFDSLCFCLFDKSSRTFRASDILNFKKGSFHCKLEFEINGISYFIERHARRTRGNHVKVDVNFWKEEGGEVVSLNGEDRRDTNKIIRQYVGSYDDFVLTSLSLQNNNALFIDKSQTERKDLLMKFLGVDIFDKLYTLAYDDIRDKYAVMKQFKKDDFTEQLAVLEVSLDESKKEYEQFQKSKKETVTQKKKLERKIHQFNKNLNKIDSSIIDVDVLKDKRQFIKDSIELHKESLGKLNAKLQEIIESDVKYTNRFNELRQTKIESDIIVYTKKSDSLKDIQQELDKLKISVKSQLEKLKHLEKHEYDPNCEYCMNNVFVKDAIKTRDSIADEKKRVQKLVNKRNELQEYVDSHSDIPKVYDELQLVIGRRSTINLKKLNVEKEIHKLELEINSEKIDLKDIKHKIDEYYKNERAIAENKEIESKVEELSNQLDTCDERLAEVDSSILNHHGVITSLEHEIESLTAKLKQAKELEYEISIYEYYLKAIKRDGIPYELISKAIPIIESETNQILQQIVDFGILLDMDGKNISGHIVYDDKNWPLELSSGMERFMSSLALRVAITNISNLPRPNFLIIDEGLGVMDATTLNSMYILIQYLKTQFDFILMISHIDSIRDMVDEFVDITKKGGFSKIQYK